MHCLLLGHRHCLSMSQKTLQGHVINHQGVIKVLCTTKQEIIILDYTTFMLTMSPCKKAKRGKRLT